MKIVLMNYYHFIILNKKKSKKRIEQLKMLIKQWDELAKDNKNNKHGLSTSQRQDWVDELEELLSDWEDD